MHVHSLPPLFSGTWGMMCLYEQPSSFDRGLALLGRLCWEGIKYRIGVKSNFDHYAQILVIILMLLFSRIWKTINTLEMSAFSFYFWEKHVKVFSTLVSDIHCKDASLPCQLIYSLSEVSSDMKVEEYIYI